MKLSLLIVAINGWNRVQIGFRAVPQVTTEGKAASWRTCPIMAPLPFQSAAAKIDPYAYRMLGSVTDAEDMVQEEFLCWFNTDRETICEPETGNLRVVRPHRLTPGALAL